jgi:lipopolysaccharide/colanic/teichoic acid biosynthesis glycosyltransferase
LERGGDNAVSMAPPGAIGQIEAIDRGSAIAAVERVPGITLERSFDLALLVLLAPVILIVGAAIAIAIYLDSPGPVIFRSLRVGRDGELFEMLKFRKMRTESEDYPVTLANDTRFTPIGRFLAATRLDELPQVVNVLRGEMRLVGPRPELECFVAEFAEEYTAILEVSPGITGHAQLRFLDEKALLQGEDPATIYCDHVLPQKVKIDVEYARTRTIRGDLAILGRTVVLPISVLAAALRVRHRTLRTWLPATLLAAALVVAFALSSSNVG